MQTSNKAFSFQRGLLLSVVVSAIATAPRIVRPNAEDFSYLISHFAYLFVLTFAFWIASPFFIKGRYLALKVLGFLILGGIFSVVYHRFSEVFFTRFTTIYNDLPFLNDVPFRRKRLLFFRGVAFAAVIYFIEYYFKMLFETQKTSLEIEQLKKERLQAQLSSLHEQISPHFLFNSLSTLQTMVTDSASRNYILQLSNVYRYLLAFNENHLATLRDELEFLKSYTHILKERFEDAFQLDLKIDESVLDAKLPPLTLQLLVENAIKHNVVSFDEPLLIAILSDRNDRIVVSNRLQPRFSKEAGTGTGLKNIDQRCQLLIGKGIEISDADGHFRVSIPLLH